MPVYPRWRGEHFQMSNEFISYDGLSPLARGTPVRLVRFIGEVRFIPAGAGNTSDSQLARMIEAVYPRWRGEHIQLNFDLDFPPGLSPLARGTPDQAVRHRRPPTVYPRWRGEHR